MNFADHEDSEHRKAGLRISRQTYTKSDFDDKFERNTEPGFSLGQSVKRVTTACCSPRSLKNAFFRFFPFISIMQHYNWKTDLIRDVIAGATVSAMHIPQGMAYGQLASLRPVHGLYVSFFPVLLYFFFGTSRQLSVGSFAVISLMVAKVLDGEFSKDGFFANDINNNTIENATIGEASNNSSLLTNISSYSAEDMEMEKRVELAVSLNFITGLLQILLGFLGAGFVTRYLSEPFISGYTTGCACHVFTSQLKYVFGVATKRHTGAFKIYQTWRDVILNLPSTNPVTLGISLSGAAFLLICKLVVDPRLPKIKQMSRMPIPAELILIIVADAVSFLASFGPDFDVKVVGHIPGKFPSPRVPTYFTPQLVVDSIPLVLVSFSLCISMGKLFSKQYKYDISPNQEFFAIGIANAVSSFFDCYTASASMSRSLVQANVGGQTQLAAVVSCIIILCVILFLGSLLYSLPTCVLAVVVMVNLRGMFMQAKDLPKYWKHCKVDAITWFVAFIVTVVVDVDIGLYVGVCFVLITVIYHSARVQSSILRQAGTTELFAQTKQYGSLSSTFPAVVVRWSSPIYFATVDTFIPTISKAANVSIANTNQTSVPHADDSAAVDLSTQAELEPVKAVVFGADEEPLSVLVTGIETDIMPVMSSPANDTLTPRRSHSRNEDSYLTSSPVPSSSNRPKNITAVILEMSGVGFIDTVGLDAINQLAKDLSAKGVDLLLASCPECVLSVLSTEKSLQEFCQMNIFMSPVDALVAVRRSDTFAQFNSGKGGKLQSALNRSPPRTRSVRHSPKNIMDSQTSLIQSALGGTNPNGVQVQSSELEQTTKKLQTINESNPADEEKL